MNVVPLWTVDTPAILVGEAGTSVWEKQLSGATNWAAGSYGLAVQPSAPKKHVRVSAMFQLTEAIA